MSTVAELQKKATTLEAAYQNNLATAKLLMKELAAGAVPCAELLRYNEVAKAVWASQFALWSKLALNGLITGNLPAFPPLPILFSELAPGEGLFFHCRTGADIVGPQQFAAVRLDKPLEFFFGKQVQATGELGLAFIPLIIAGITVVVSAAVVTKVAVDASKEKALSQHILDAQLDESRLRLGLAQRREAFQKDCWARGGAVKECAAASVAAAEKLPDDYRTQPGSPTLWLFGGSLGVLGILGGVWLYRNRSTNK